MTTKPKSVLTNVQARLETAATPKFTPDFMKVLVDRVTRNAQSTWPSDLLEKMADEEKPATQADYLLSAFDGYHPARNFPAEHRAELKTFAELKPSVQLQVFLTVFKGLPK